MTTTTVHQRTVSVEETGGGNCDQRVIRGGSWNSDPVSCVHLTGTGQRRHRRQRPRLSSRPGHRLTLFSLFFYPFLWLVRMRVREILDDHFLIKPELVAQIEFTEWTPDGHLRHSKFVGLREDKERAGGCAGGLKLLQSRLQLH